MAHKRCCRLVPQTIPRPALISSSHRRALSTRSSPNYGFVFDIDGVLLRSKTPLAPAAKALKYLRAHRVPFVLLTNGGGYAEAERARMLAGLLDVPLAEAQVVQAHTPFQTFVRESKHGPPMQRRVVLVVGGAGDRCRAVAESYGFENVVTPADIYMHNPDVWPSSSLVEYYKGFARPLPKPLFTPSATHTLEENIQIGAVLVFNDPVDWGLDIQIIMDVLLAYRGFHGTLSKPEEQDARPLLILAANDLWYPSRYHLNRLGQGGFHAALAGVWTAATGTPLPSILYGKPGYEAYQFAEARLVAHKKLLRGSHDATDSQESVSRLKNIYMVGDNPNTDIKGANDFKSPSGANWHSLLVRTGVFNDGDPLDVTPTAIVADVWDAVRWAVENESRC
ncbi:MAG: hypothetical protein M1829_004405 [Trizodia sp. TS-e1964]|nr:MAG: hypothetical protein M1829_004405 [Trizodia sp. TS-e1964]